MASVEMIAMSVNQPEERILGPVHQGALAGGRILLALQMKDAVGQIPQYLAIITFAAGTRITPGFGRADEYFAFNAPRGTPQVKSDNVSHMVMGQATAVQPAHGAPFEENHGK
jgi:hypothetical protein